MDEAWRVERAVARFAATLALATLGGGLAWFAYIDAPISDRVMLWVAFAAAAATVAVLAALGVLALTLAAAPAEATGAQRRSRRLLRLALAALAVLVVLLAMASVATLNLRGAGNESETEDTATAV